MAKTITRIDIDALIAEKRAEGEAEIEQIRKRVHDEIELLKKTRAILPPTRVQSVIASTETAIDDEAYGHTMRLVRNAVALIKGHFSAKMVRQEIRNELHPEADSELEQDTTGVPDHVTVSKCLVRMRQRGELLLITEGRGRRAAVYTRRVRLDETEGEKP